MGLINTLIVALRARFMPILTKLRLWTSAAFWQGRVFTVLRGAFQKLFDVRPRNKKDYYTIFSWMVSKRLAFAAVAVVGLLCGVNIYFTVPKSLFAGSGEDGKSSLRTYKYNVIPLKFYEGEVRILARDGHLAYEGSVAKAQCTGTGVLYDKDGGKVYEGQFENSMYSGNGKLYYPEGMLCYQGEFSQNLFHGTGEYLRPGGTKEYTGAYSNGQRNGTGTLYNVGGSPVFHGTFLNDKIVYSDFLGKATSETAQMYTGTTTVYSSTEEYAVSLNEIDAVYTAKSGDNAVDGEWRVEGIYVLSGKLPVDGIYCESVEAASARLGKPDYFGSTWLTLAELVAVNRLAAEGNSPWGTLAITKQESLDGVYLVDDYNREVEAYIHTYIRAGVLYTVFSTVENPNDIVMYCMQTA